VIIPLKQSVALLYWLAVGMLFQTLEPSPDVPIMYAFAGAIGVGLLVTLIWIVSPLISARMYRERITDLECKVRDLERRLDEATAQNARLGEANRRYEQDLRAAMETVADLSRQINGMKRANGQSTDR
jgi:hypothetical protein